MIMMNTRRIATLAAAVLAALPGYAATQAGLLVDEDFANDGVEESAVMLEDDFSAGQGDWVIRGQNVQFEDNAVKISPQGSGQPGAVYMSFDSVTLKDGEFLRVTADVAVSLADPRAGDIRIGLGQINPTLEADSTDLAVPGMKGYFTRVPSGGSTADSRVEWVHSGENFFNPSPSDITGIGSMANNASVGTTSLPWVWEVRRSGENLVFSGSLGGEAFENSVAATGDNVIGNYQFNTLGLAYVYSSGEYASFDNVQLETGTSGIEHDWATRGWNVRFEDGVLNIDSGSGGNPGQPGAAYLSFAPVELEDGEYIRLTVDVSVSRLDGRLRDVRLGLGHANPTIWGHENGSGVPLSGYFVTAPSGGNTADHRIWWNDAGDGERNFFNSSTAMLGDISNSRSVETEMVTWIWQVERVGNELAFSSSLDGQPLTGGVTAGGNNVIQNFRFNTVGLAYAFSPDETATFDNLKLETNSIRGVGQMDDVGGRFGSVRFIEIIDELTYAGGEFELETLAVGDTVYIDETVRATEDEVIQDFRFDTVGLAYVYRPGETATYGNVKVETGTEENAVVVVDDTFIEGQGDWATRGENVRFEDETLKVSPRDNGQPGAAYLSFAPVDLQDGEFLRLTADVYVSNPNPQARDLRVGLGYAHADISGDDDGHMVPLTGYIATAPSGGDTTDSRVYWNYAGEGTRNFFNSLTSTPGDMPNNVSVGTEMVTWVWEVRRYGDDLIFTGSIDGETFEDQALITSLPPELEGNLAIKTTNDPELRPEENLEPYLGFVVDRPTTLYIAYDSAAAVPVWLSRHYASTSLQVEGTDASFDIWSRPLEARERVALLFDTEALQPADNNFWVILSHGPDVITESPDLLFVRSSFDSSDWALDAHHWTLATGADSALHTATMLSEVTDLDPDRGFSLSSNIRVPRLQEAGDNAFGFSLFGERDGLRAEWLPRQADGTSVLRLVDASSGEVLQSEPWTGLIPTAIDNDVGVGSGATEVVFGVGSAPFGGDGSGTIFAEDFDGDVSEWETGSNNEADDEWEIGDRQDNGAGGAFVGQNVATTGFDGYSTNSDFWLRSPVIDLTNVSNVSLSFQEYVDMDWEDENGEPFHFGTIAVLDADTLEEIEVLGISRSYEGEPLEWALREFDLVASEGRRIVLEFTFVSDGFSWSGDGWFVDDIQVTGEALAIVSMPEALALDGTLNGIVTDREDVDNESSSYLEFTVSDRAEGGNDGVTVYVAWDARGSGLEPDWLRNNFRRTDHVVGLSGAARHRLWAREFEDGATVTLGGASAGGGGPFPASMNNYFVLLGDTRPGLEEFYTLHSEGFRQGDAWNVNLSLSDQNGESATVAVETGDNFTGSHFGLFARQPDAAGAAIVHPPLWEIFDLTIDFLDLEELPDFQAWREFHFADHLDQPDVSGPHASPAGDGVANLIKYALDLSPWEPVVTEDLTKLVPDETGVLVIRYWKRTDIDDIEYIPEVSEDLPEWRSGPPHVEESILSTEGTRQEIEARGNVSEEAESGFMRLKIRQKE